MEQLTTHSYIGLNISITSSSGDKWSEVKCSDSIHAYFVKTTTTTKKDLLLMEVQRARMRFSKGKLFD